MIDIKIWLFLPAILFLGATTSYEDIKHGKIRNKWIISAIVYAAIVYILEIALSYFSENLDFGPLLLQILNVFIALIFGYLLWVIGLWSAGDGKLFFAYSALIPMSVYFKDYVGFFPSIILLINTFIPLFVFYFCLLLFKVRWGKNKREIIQIFNLKRIIILALFLFSLSWIFEIMPFKITFLIKFLILFLIVAFLEKILKKEMIWFIFIICILRLGLDKNIYSFSFAKNFLLVLVSFILLRFLLFDLGHMFFTKKKRINELKEGMILAEKIKFEKGKFRKEKDIAYSLFSYLRSYSKRKQYLFEKSMTGLTKKEINELIRLEKENKLKFANIRVQETVPFAPFILGGVLLTIVLRGSIFSAINSFFITFI